MPNRTINESICYSDDLDKLQPFAETVFYRLIVNVDDYGRIDARPSFLKSRLFATKQGVTEKSVSEAVAQLELTGIVKSYIVSDRVYLYFPKWHLHQRIRGSEPKYPEPPQESGNVVHLEAVCENPRQVAASCREPPQGNLPDNIYINNNICIQEIISYLNSVLNTYLISIVQK